jgi:hypothetical protein
VYLNHAKAVAVLCAIAILSGCASPSQIRTEVSEGITQVNKNTYQCYAPLRSDPQYRELLGRLHLGGKKPSAQQLADTGTLSPEAVHAYLSWYAETSKCDVGLIEAFANFDPLLGAKIVEWQAERADIERDAIENNRTYGHINSRIETLYTQRSRDTEEYMDNETSRRLRNRQQNIDAGLVVFSVAVAILAQRQAALAQTQNKYQQSAPRTQASQTAGAGINNVKVPLGTTKCNVAANAVQCFLTGAH